MDRRMSDFSFNPDTHVYTLDGTQIPSVTQVLSDVGMVDGRLFTEEARVRGTYVHRATEFIDSGSLDWEALDPALFPYCTAYMKFIEDIRPEILLSERPLYHPDFKYAGTLDRLMKFGGSVAIVDFSTGDPLPTKEIQVSAYRELMWSNRFTEIGNHFISKGFTLWLRNDGTYRLSNPIDIKDMVRKFNIFLAALTVVRWKKEAA